MTTTTIDERKLEQFVGHVATELGAALNAALVTLGAELGLYRAMADGQPVTSAELATRTGTLERYVREWLNVQAASGFVVYEPGLDAYVLPPEHALVLADDASPVSMIADFQGANAAVAVRERLAERFISGEGVGWHEHHHGLCHGTERSFGINYRTHLVAEWLPALDGVVAKLEARSASSPTSAAGTARRRSSWRRRSRPRGSSASTTTRPRSRPRASAPPRPASRTA